MSAPAKKFLWVAVRGSAVPHWPMPATMAEMRNSAVYVGGEQT
jgi:hypothetical protein